MFHPGSNIPYSAPYGTYKNKISDDSPINSVDLTALNLSFKKRVSRHFSFVYSTIIETENFNDLKKSIDRKSIAGISNFEAALQLFKIIVGTGILFMPLAFRSVGVGLGLILIVFIALITIRAFEFVIEASQYFSKINQVQSYSFSDTFRLAIEKWPAFSPYAKFGQYLVSWLIIIACYSVCMVYVLLIAQNVQEILPFFGWNISFEIIVAIQFPLLILLTSFTSLKSLTSITTVALISLWSGIGLTAYAISRDLSINGVNAEKEKWEFTKIPSFLGIVLFAFNGIASLTAIENNMNNPKELIGCPSVVCVVVLATGIIYTGYGLLGYFTYGSSTLGPVLQNFSPTATFNVILKIAIVIGLFFSCPIMLFAPLTIVSEYVYEKAALGRKKTMRYLMRWLQIFVIVLVPLLIQNMLTLLELLSSFNLILQFIIPVLIDILTFTSVRQGAVKVISILRNICLLAIGIWFVCITFYSGMRNVLKL